MAEAEVDLAKLFSAVTRDLKGNQAALNQADAYNHNHGDNMVKNFKAITKALKEKPLEALAQAVMAGSQMNASPHHSQSGQLVAGSLINTLAGMLGGKKQH